MKIIKIQIDRRITLSNLIKNFLGYLKLGEEEYEDEYEETEVEKEPYYRTEPKIKKSFETSKIGQEKERKRERIMRTSNNKIVPIKRTGYGFEVCIMKPESFEDAQDICDMLLENRAVVVNLERVDAKVAQRIMDFVSGAIYAIEGKLHQIAEYIFIFSPDSVDISGDYLDFVKETGFGVPTIHKSDR